MGLKEKFFGELRRSECWLRYGENKVFNDEVSNITGLTVGLYRIEAKNWRRFNKINAIKRELWEPTDVSSVLP